MTDVFLCVCSSIMLGKIVFISSVIRIIVFWQLYVLSLIRATTNDYFDNRLVMIILKTINFTADNLTLVKKMKKIPRVFVLLKPKKS